MGKKYNRFLSDKKALLATDTKKVFTYDNKKGVFCAMFPVETISAKMLDYYVGRSDSMMIDLRGREEYAAGHVRGAVNIPYEELEEGRKDFPQKLLVLYCDRGGASLKAAKLLARRGYETRSVIGGFAAYRGRNLVISQRTW